MKVIDIEHSRIMVVDDEPTNLKLLDKMLRRQGYQNLQLLLDPRTVLESYQCERPDLILLDLSMPHLDGFAVLAQLKSLEDPLLPPVVILTAQSEREMVIKALSAGARDFIGKPFDRLELLMRVRNLLEAQRAHRWVFDQQTLLEELVQQRTDALHETRLQVIRRLGRAAEYRDNETGLHIIRMSKISALLAKALGWDSEQCQLMLHASPMHDVGKIGISDAILLKPGRLSADEWAVMQTHSAIGASILEGDDSALLEMARVIARSHHERWDGSGYPDGLKGEAIPESARIVAVADVFDALTSARPYKTAWPIDRALALIREGAGHHFDPQVVKAFFEHLPEILEIRERYLDPQGT